jgi:PleD family two-component response regulator
MNAEQRGLVLLVDDDAVQRTYLRACLEAEFDIIEAEDGPSALARLAVAPPVDLVLLDVEMPGMDGYAVLGRIRRNPGLRDLPVLILTARDGEVDEELGLNLGASDFQIKPPRPAVLASRARNLVQAHWERMDLAGRVDLDPISGLVGKRRFHETLDKEWRRASRAATLLCLVLFDLRGGDIDTDAEAIRRRVGALLREVVGRPGDLAADLDGGVFALLLPGTDDVGGRRVAETLRRRLMRDGVLEGSVSMGVGGAAALPSSEEGGDALFLRHVRHSLDRAHGLGPGQMVWDPWSPETSGLAN